MTRAIRQSAAAALVGLGLAASIGGSCVVREWKEVGVTQAESAARLARVEGEILKLTVTTSDGQEHVGYLVAFGEESLTLRTGNDDVVLILAEVASISIRQMDPGASEAATTAVSVLAVVPAVLLLVLLVAALAKTSCPFVYLLLPDGSAVLLGETYSGAVYGALERDDLLELPAVGPGPLRLRLASEAHEEHHTDKAVLWLVEHAAGQRAVATHDARALVIGPGEPPVAAVDLQGVDQLQRLATADEDPWRTDLDAAAASRPRPTQEGLVLRFEGLAAGPAALELVAANTPWQDVVAAELWARTGDRLDEIHARYAVDDPQTRERLERWRRRAGVDLCVERRDGQGWIPVAWVPPQGWAHTRHVVVPLEAPDGALELRLRGGVGFWLVDQAALAPVVDTAPAVSVLPPIRATTWDGRDEAAALAATDDRRQVLPHRDTWVDLAFTLPAASEGRARTALLATRGWYRVLPRQEGAPDRRTVARVGRHPEEASALSLELWEAFQERVGHIVVRVGAPEDEPSPGG